MQYSFTGPAGGFSQCASFIISPMLFDLKKSVPKAGQRHALPAAHGSADSFMLSQVAGELRTRGRMLTIIAANATDAQRLLNEIPWFGAQHESALRCHLLPDWETLPYDAFSPHQDLVSERLATLYEVQSGQCDVLIAPATTALVRMAPPSFLAAYTFFFKQGEKLEEARLKSQLTLAGYAHVSQVMQEAFSQARAHREQSFLVAFAQHAHAADLQVGIAHFQATQFAGRPDTLRVPVSPFEAGNL